MGKTVDSINIHRRVYGSPLDDNLAGVPIDSYELFKKPAVVAPVAPPPPPMQPVTASPFVQNYYQRTQAQIAAANAPEVIESDEFA